MRSPKTHLASESNAAVSGYSKADGPSERLSRISCECHQSAGRKRCSASPEPEGQEGKENELRMGLGLDSCRVNGTLDKQEPEDMECEETGKNLFPDDDSNQILPVEQFFGNLDAVQVRQFGLSPQQGQTGAQVGLNCFVVVQRKHFPADGRFRSGGRLNINKAALRSVVF